MPQYACTSGTHSVARGLYLRTRHVCHRTAEALLYPLFFEPLALLYASRLKLVLRLHAAVDPVVRDFYGRTPLQYKQQAQPQYKQPSRQLAPSRTYYVRPPPNSTTFRFPPPPPSYAPDLTAHRRSRTSLHAPAGASAGASAASASAAATLVVASAAAAGDASAVPKSAGPILHVEMFRQPNVIKKRRRVYHL